MYNYSTITSSYTTINAIEESYLDQWGKPENWKLKTRVVIPSDYIAPDCFWYVRNVQPSLLELNVSLTENINQSAYNLVVYRCSICNYTASLCSTLNSLTLTNQDIQTLQIQLDDISCVVIRLYSDIFPLLIYRGSTLPYASLSIKSMPPTCECVDCDADQKAITLLKPSFIQSWASRYYMGMIDYLLLDAYMKKTSMDMYNNLTQCIDLTSLRSESLSLAKQCGYPTMLAAMVRFSNYAYQTTKTLFQCTVDYIDMIEDHTTVIMKLNGLIILHESSMVMSTQAYFVEGYVNYGENLFECYMASSGYNRAYLSLQYFSISKGYYIPFSLEIKPGMQAAYDCINDNITCGPCSIGKQASANKGCACESCIEGTYGIFQVTEQPYQCIPCPLNQYSDVKGSVRCLDCPPNSITFNDSTTSINECTCVEGYYKAGKDQASRCVLCPPGTFKSSIDNANECTPCPNAQMASMPGSTSEFDCYCPAGFVLEESICIPCPPNTYQYNRTHCEVCILNSRSNTATLSIQGCNCIEGYAGIDCNECDIGYFKDRNGVCLSSQYFIQDVSASLHTCAIFESLTAKCWGLNDMGQLGYLDQINRGDVAGTMGDYLTTIQARSRFKKIITARSWSCALFEDTNLKCWGNTRNNLNEIQYFYDYAPVMIFGVTALDMCAGYDHGCAIFDDNAIRCWGNNDYGQLGIGNRKSYYLYPYQITPSHPWFRV
eukprot:764550-Hanusia_phi.AAC.1